MSQLLWVLVALMFLKRFAGVNWINWMFDSGAFILLMIGWLVALSYYFTLDRTDALQKKLAEKSGALKILWGVAAILSALVPIVVLSLLAPK